MCKTRGLSDEFICALLSGELRPFLDTVCSDDSLCIEIRDNYLNIYYRGGNIYRIKHSRKGYFIKFAHSYFGMTSFDFPQAYDLAGWHTRLEKLKKGMDGWFVMHPKSERETQQKITVSNASKPADYIIADIEYTAPEQHFRFDMVGVNLCGKPRLSLFELKQGDSSVAGKAGITKHLEDVSRAVCNPSLYNTLLGEIQKISEQKQTLGLLPTIENTEFMSQQKPEFIFLLRGHNPKSQVPDRELRKVIESVKYLELKASCDVKISFMADDAYTLYASNMQSLEDYIRGH